MDAEIEKALSPYNEEMLIGAEILMKYSSYIEKEKELADKMLRFENITILPDYDYYKINSLSHEAKEKLNKSKMVILVCARVEYRFQQRE